MQWLGRRSGDAAHCPMVTKEEAHRCRSPSTQVSVQRTDANLGHRAPFLRALVCLSAPSLLGRMEPTRLSNQAAAMRCFCYRQQFPRCRLGLLTPEVPEIASVLADCRLGSIRRE